MFKRFVCHLILITYVHQILISSVAHASNSFDLEADFVIKVKSYNGLSLKLKQNGKQLIDYHIQENMDETTDSENGEGEGESYQGSNAETKNFNNTKKNQAQLSNLGLSTLQQFYGTNNESLGWIWNLHKYQLPSLVINLDGKVSWLNEDNVADKVIRLKAKEVILSEVSSQILQIQSPKVSFQGKNYFKNLELKGFTCEIEKEANLNSQNLNILTSLINHGKIACENLNMQGYDLANSGEISVSKRSFVQTDIFDNQGFIEAKENNLLVSSSFNNSGDLKGTQLEAVTLGDFANSGRIQGEKTSIIAQADLLNHGEIKAQDLKLKAANIINHHKLIGYDTEINLSQESGKLLNHKTGRCNLGALTCNPIAIINEGEEAEGNEEKINGQVTIKNLSDSSTIKRIENGGRVDLIEGGMHIGSLTNTGRVSFGQDKLKLGKSPTHHGNTLYIDELQNNGVLQHSQESSAYHAPFITLEKVKGLNKVYNQFIYDNTQDKIGKVFAFAKSEIELLKKVNFTEKNSSTNSHALNSLLALTFLLPSSIEKQLKPYLHTRSINPNEVLQKQVAQEISNNTTQLNCDENERREGDKKVTNKEPISNHKSQSFIWGKKSYKVRVITAEELNILKEVLPTLGQYFYCQEQLDKTLGISTNQENLQEFWFKAISLIDNTSSAVFKPYLSYVWKLLNLGVMSKELADFPSSREAETFLKLKPSPLENSLYPLRDRDLPQNIWHSQHLEKIDAEIKQKCAPRSFFSLEEVRLLDKDYQQFKNTNNKIGKVFAFAKGQLELLKGYDFTEHDQHTNRNAKNALLSLTVLCPSKIEKALGNKLQSAIIVDTLPVDPQQAERNRQVNNSFANTNNNSTQAQDNKQPEQIKWLNESCKARSTTDEELHIIWEVLTTVGRYFYCQDLINNYLKVKPKQQNWQGFWNETIAGVRSQSSSHFLPYLNYLEQLLNFATNNKNDQQGTENEKAFFKAQIKKISGQDYQTYHDFWTKKLQDLECEIGQKHAYKTKRSLTVNSSKDLGKVMTEGEIIWQMSPQTLSNKISLEEVLKGSLFEAPHLTINHPDFINNQNLEFNLPVTIEAQKFTNQGLLKAKSLKIMANDLINGLDNDHMGELSTFNGFIHIETKGNVDNRFGKIISRAENKEAGWLKIISQEGDILSGSSRGEEYFAYYYGCVDGGGWGCRSGLYTFNRRNTALIASTGNLKLISLKNKIELKHSRIFSYGKTSLKTLHPLNLISYLLDIDNDCTIEAPVINFTREDIARVYYWGWKTKVNEDINNWFQEHECSEPTITNITGNLELLSKEVLIDSSALKVGKNLTFNNLSVGITDHPSGFKLNARSINRMWGRVKLFGRLLSPGTPDHTFANSKPILIIGDKFEVKTDTFEAINAVINSSNLSIEAKDLILKNLSRTREVKDPQQGMLFDLSNWADKKVEQGLATRDSNGMVRSLLSKDNSQNSLIDANKIAILGENNKIAINGLAYVDPALVKMAVMEEMAREAHTLNFKGLPVVDLIDQLHANGLKIKTNTKMEVLKPELFEQLGQAVILYKAQKIKEQFCYIANLYLPKEAINPFDQSGDMSAQRQLSLEGSHKLTTENTRIKGGEVEIKGGTIERKTGKYQVYSSTENSYTITDVSMPQEQIIATQGDVKITTKGNLSETGTLTKAANDIKKEVGGIYETNPLVLTKTTVTTEHKSGGLFGDDKEIKTTQSSNTFLPNQNLAGRDYKVRAEKDILLTGEHIQAGNAIYLESTNGKILTEAGKANNTYSVSTNTESFGGKETNQTNSQSQTTFCMSHFEAGLVIVKAQRAKMNGISIITDLLIDDTVKGLEIGASLGTVEFSQSFEVSNPLAHSYQWKKNWQQIMCQSDLSKVKKIISKKDPNYKDKEMILTSVIWDRQKTIIEGKYREAIQELQKGESSGGFSHQVIPIGAIQVLALTSAVGSIIVSGGVSGLVAQGLFEAMGSAALNVIQSHVIFNMASHGNMVETLKSLKSDRSMRQIAVSMAASGILQQVQSRGWVNLNVEGSTSFIDHLKVSAINNGANMAAQLVFNKDSTPSDILKQGALSIIANTIGGYGASQIGVNFDGNLAAQTTAHFLSSGTAGWILDQSSKGFISAGMGAVVAKLMMSSMQTSALEEERQINNKANGEGKLLSIEERKLNLKNILDKQIAISQITSASVAAMAEYDPDLAAHMGGMTARNNCVPALLAYLMTSTYATMVYYDVMDVFDKQGAWAALERLSWEGAVYTATLGLGEIVKIGDKAIKIAGKVYHNPIEAWNAVKGQVAKLGRAAKGESALGKSYRPTPRQSEIDVTNSLGNNYKAQQSFKAGEEVNYGTKGSVRPDNIHINLKDSIEVKNYTLTTRTDDLIKNITDQAIQRQQHLPQGMVQKVVIDVRGQSVSANQWFNIKQTIENKTGGIIAFDNIKFFGELK